MSVSGTSAQWLVPQKFTTGGGFTADYSAYDVQQRGLEITVVNLSFRTTVLLTDYEQATIVTRDEWLAAQKALLVKEKELTRANDALSAQRRHLPMVKVDKTYTFKGPSNTTVTLSDLFDGCDQLIIYHFMFKPGDDEGCRGCSHIGESLPDVRHLRLKNTNLVCVSRGDVDKLEAFRQKNGWAWPWYSSGESDFNYDFYATVDEAVCPMLLNFRSKEEMEAEGKSWYTGDVPGFSVFLKKDGDIFHTYSTFARGGEKTMPTLALLDMSPLGRQTGQYGPAEFKLKYEYD